MYPGSNLIFSPLNEYDISVFPIERQGRLLHNTFNFGANCPLHLSIPAYHLPVYASRCLLPYTAQDSVLDCWLGFVKAVIADHSLPCASRRNSHTTWHTVPYQGGSCQATLFLPCCLSSYKRPALPREFRPLLPALRPSYEASAKEDQKLGSCLADRFGPLSSGLPDSYGLC